MYMFFNYSTSVFYDVQIVIFAGHLKLSLFFNQVGLLYTKTKHVRVHRIWTCICLEPLFLVMSVQFSIVLCALSSVFAVDLQCGYLNVSKHLASLQ